MACINSWSSPPEPANSAATSTGSPSLSVSCPPTPEMVSSSPMKRYSEVMGPWLLKDAAREQMAPVRGERSPTVMSMTQPSVGWSGPAWPKPSSSGSSRIQ